MRQMRSVRTDAVRAYEKKYREKMCPWVARLKNKHRVKLHGLDGDFSITQWKELCEKHGNKCVMCGGGGLMTYDHVIPLSRWKEWAEKNKPDYRANDIQNLQPLCLSCNSSKGSK